MSRFITNQDETLKQITENIIDSTERLFFLVGYFYFGGFELIAEKLEEKEMKILIGLDAEKRIKNTVSEFEQLWSSNVPRLSLRQGTYDSIVTIFNETDFFDTRAKSDAFRLFLRKIADGTLEIKKTEKPNHAKLYLFEKKPEYSEKGQAPGVVVTGSSNFSKPGFEGQYEINVILRDRDDYVYAKNEIFDRLWATSISIADGTTKDDFKKQVVDRIWLNRQPKPYLLYLRTLEEYFALGNHARVKLPSQITNDGFLDLRYQTDAIVQGISILKKHNGIIIADVVGLGKSIIASTIAHNLDLHTIIIAPPHLRNQWEEYRQIFDYNAVVYTSGSIERALEENAARPNQLIIVDEAHKYRNELTEDYANLHRLCVGNKVVLLTATPFNNRPQDIFSLIHLFQIPGRSTLTHIENLSQRFRELVLEYKRVQEERRKKSKTEIELKNELERISEAIRHIISPVVIRRSRIDLKAIDDYSEDLKAQGIEFPLVEPPLEIDYALGEIEGIYVKTLEDLASDAPGRGFIGARYKPTSYIGDISEFKKVVGAEFDDDEMINLFRQSQVNIADFMKKLLVRRFESSVHAFEHSLASIIQSSQKIYDYYTGFGKVPIYKKGDLPDYDELISAYEDDDSGSYRYDFNELDERGAFDAYKKKGLIFLDASILSDKFKKDLEHDIELLRAIHDRWFGSKRYPDPKLKRLKAVMKEKLKENGERKLVIFTEFADTAHYLQESLAGEFRVFKYSSGDANESNKRAIKENFDAAYRVRKDEYDVLVATDAISEGFNLHRAGVVFNYDIPFNPTRVIQRVGRINRVNKKVFERLYICNFFPSATGEAEIATRIIASLKLFMIHTLLGEDTRVLSEEENPTSYFKDKYDEYKKRFGAELEETTPTWEAEHLNYLRKMQRTKPEAVKEARGIPRRVRIRRMKPLAEEGVLVFGKKGSEYTFKLGKSDGTVKPLGAWDALALFRAEMDEEAFPESDAFEEIYANLKNQLFTVAHAMPGDKGFRDSIAAIVALIKSVPEKADYLHDLRHVAETLHALPERYLKTIRTAIKDKKLSALEKVGDLERDIPHKYLARIIDSARQIDEGEETLILSEELLP